MRTFAATLAVAALAWGAPPADAGGSFRISIGTGGYCGSGYSVGYSAGYYSKGRSHYGGRYSYKYKHYSKPRVRTHYNPRYHRPSYGHDRVVYRRPATVYRTTTYCPPPTKTVIVDRSYDRYEHRRYETPSRRVYKTTAYSHRVDGWDALADGNARAALDAFADEAPDRPNQGEPKVGFALASVALGNDERAVWAIRRAIRTDARAFFSIPQSRGVRDLVDAQASRYGDAVMYSPNDGDAWLILAALRAIQGDEDGAYVAAGKARELRAVGAGRLLDVLDERSDRRMYGG